MPEPQSALSPLELGKTGLLVSPLGLGCSHIASLSTRRSAAEIASLLDRAWDGGVRVFDTADIYGQGDSERRLASVARRPGAVICTKAGLALKASQALVRLVKPVLRPLLARDSRVRRAAARARQESEVHDLDPARLRARLEKSLRRLRRDDVEIFLLHSPPRCALEDGMLFDLLDDIRRSGIAQNTGVSCQSLADAEWILSKERVQVIEIPLNVATLKTAAPVLDAARAQGVGVIAREVLAGRSPDEALAPLIADPRVHVALTGTTNPDHLDANIRACTRALPC